MTRQLSKRAFYEEIGRQLTPNGWRSLPGAASLSALFGKRVNNLILTLGFDESQLYQARITAEFLLAAHTSIILSVPDFPPSGRARIGQFLRPEERAELLDPDWCTPGVKDAWWTGRTQENIYKIVRAVTLAAPRFTEQPGLREQIARSLDHSAYVAKLADIAKTPFNPADKVRDVPESWVTAAFTLLPDAHPKYRAAFAKQVAADAWRTHRILPGDHAADFR